MSNGAAGSPRGGFVVGQIDIKILLAFIFGLSFLASILIYAAFVQNPSVFAQRVFITVLAIAGAATAALIPGILQIKLPFIRAGGALAVFAVVFFFQPSILEKTSTFTIPAVSSLSAALLFAEKIDNNEIDIAWHLLDSESKETLARDRSAFRDVFAAARAPLGKAKKRERIGMNRVTSPNGYPLGVYEGLTFRTKFANDSCRQEVIHSRSADGVSWHVFDYNVGIANIPCN